MQVPIDQCRLQGESVQTKRCLGGEARRWAKAVVYATKAPFATIRRGFINPSITLLRKPGTFNEGTP